MSSSRKVSATKDYRLFTRSSENRITNLAKHKKLEESMKVYGFLPCYPIICYRDPKTGKLIVKDGQHRLQIAETLGLTIYWIEETVDFDVAIVNSAAKGWSTRDYAEKHAANGIKAYVDGLEFADRHAIPVGITFAILAGTTTFKNIESSFRDGTFKIKDRSWAEAIAGIYGPITTLSSDTKNAAFLAACMAVCRVKDFDPKRLLGSAARCRDKLLSYSTRAAYLDMLQEVYNFGRKQLVDLNIQATIVMRERNATVASSKKAKMAREVAATSVA